MEIHKRFPLRKKKKKSCTNSEVVANKCAAWWSSSWATPASSSSSATPSSSASSPSSHWEDTDEWWSATCIKLWLACWALQGSHMGHTIFRPINEYQIIFKYTKPLLGMKARKQFAQDNQNTTQCVEYYKVKRFSFLLREFKNPELTWMYPIKYASLPLNMQFKSQRRCVKYSVFVLTGHLPLSV